MVLSQDDAGEDFLEVDGDQVFDFGRGKSEGLGLDLNDGRRELRKHVHRGIAKPVNAKTHQRRSASQHQGPVL